MDNGDDSKRNSLALIAIESHSNEDKHAAEDLAWADSCLIKDNEYLDNNWSSLKDAPLEILDNHPDSLDSSATMDDDYFNGSDLEMQHTAEGSDAGNDLAHSGGNFLAELLKKVAITGIDNLPVENKTNFLPQIPEEDAMETFHGDPFLPTYNEDQKVDLAVDSSLESLPVGNNESSTKDIFKVWDLNIPAEEFDFVEPLKKALQEAKDSTTDEAELQNKIPVPDLDQIVSGFADLSLNHDSI